MNTTNTVDTDKYDLIIFDDFGTLSNTPFKDHKPLHIQPGRKEFLAQLRQDRPASLGQLFYAVVAIKGGVAFGMQKEDAIEEVRWTAEQIATPFFAYCFGHPAPKAGYEDYSLPQHLSRRKPEPAMILEMIEATGVRAARTLMVDDFRDGQEMARRAGVDFCWAGTFFAPARLLAQKVPASGIGDDFDPFLDDEE